MIYYKIRSEIQPYLVPKMADFLHDLSIKLSQKICNSQFHPLSNACRPVNKNYPRKFLKKLQCVDFGPTIASLGQIRCNMKFIWKYDEQIDTFFSFFLCSQNGLLQISDNFVILQREDLLIFDQFKGLLKETNG